MSASIRFKTIVILALALIIGVVWPAISQAKPVDDPKEDATVVVDVYAEAGDSTARSSAYSEGSESYSEGSSSGSMSEAVSEGSESYSEGSNSESISSQGQVQYAGSDVRVGGNNSSFRYNYQEAAKTAAALTTAVCQDGTSLQGVKFGISKVNQSVFCMYTVTAQLSLGISASMVCEDGPDYPMCIKEKRALFIQGVNLLTSAIQLANEKAHRGLFKRLFRKAW